MACQEAMTNLSLRRDPARHIVGCDMPNERDEDVVAFMAEVMRRMGITSASELAERMIAAGQLELSSLRTVTRWTAGEAAPSWRSTMWLLRQAGMLSGQEGPAPQWTEEQVEAWVVQLERVVAQGRAQLEAERRLRQDRPGRQQGGPSK